MSPMDASSADPRTARTRRHRRDRCPGALRPWPADDGLLVRLRLVGGRLSARSLRGVAAVAAEFGDGRIHVTGRANLQLRALPGHEGRLTPEALRAVEGTGLLPSPAHDLIRNIMASPRTGPIATTGLTVGTGATAGTSPIAGTGATADTGPTTGTGGRADLRPIAAELDGLLCADPRRAGLPGRFLFVLDDGRGDLVERSCDLGLVALDARVAQLRVGDGWGPAVPLSEAPAALVRLADEFLTRRGEGPSAAWHVTELPAPLTDPLPPDPRLPTPAPPLPYGPTADGGRHVPVPDEGLERSAAEALADEALAAGHGEHGDLVVTPWRGVLVPGRAP